MAQFNRKTYPDNILNDGIMNLYGNSPNGDNHKRATMTYRFMTYVLKFTVWTGGGDNGKENFGFDLSINAAYTLAAMIREAVNSKEENYNAGLELLFYNGKSKQKQVSGQLIVSKRSGVISITPLVYKQPKIGFKLLPDDYQNLRLIKVDNGEPVPLEQHQASPIYALAYASMLENVLGNLAVYNYVDKETRSSNNSGSSKSGYNRSNSQHQDDDIF